MKTLKLILATLSLVSLAGFALAADKQDDKTAKTIPYPLKVCIVADDKLDDKPFVFTYQGREIKLCCDGCKPDFDKAPAKFIKKLEAAEKKAK